MKVRKPDIIEEDHKDSENNSDDDLEDEECKFLVLLIYI